MKRKPRETDADASAQDAPLRRRAAWAVVVDRRACPAGGLCGAGLRGNACRCLGARKPTDLSRIRFLAIECAPPPPPEPPPPAETPPVLTTQAEAPIVPQEVERPILPEIEPPPTRRATPLSHRWSHLPCQSLPKSPRTLPFCKRRLPPPFDRTRRRRHPPVQASAGRIGRDSGAGSRVFQPPPPYPPAALRRGLEGRVKLAVLPLPHWPTPARGDCGKLGLHLLRSRRAAHRPRPVALQWQFIGPRLCHKSPFASVIGDARCFRSRACFRRPTSAIPAHPHTSHRPTRPSLPAPHGRGLKHRDYAPAKVVGLLKRPTGSSGGAVWPSPAPPPPRRSGWG